MSKRETKLSFEDKKRYICNNMNLLTREEKLDVTYIFVRMGYKKNIKESSDGCRINLDDIPEGVINNVYGAIYHKLNKATRANK